MNDALVVAPVVVGGLFLILWVATLLDRLVAVPALAPDLPSVEVGELAEAHPIDVSQGPTGASAEPDVHPVAADPAPTGTPG